MSVNLVEPVKKLLQEFVEGVTKIAEDELRENAPYYFGTMKDSVKSEWKEIGNGLYEIRTYVDGGYLISNAPSHFDYSRAYLYGRHTYRPSPAHPELITNTVSGIQSKIKWLF